MLIWIFEMYLNRRISGPEFANLFMVLYIYLQRRILRKFRLLATPNETDTNRNRLARDEFS